MTTAVDGCVPIVLDQFQRVLAIELGTSIDFAPGAAQEPDGTTIRVGCSGPDIELQLRDNLTRKSMQRVVELPQVEAAARTRLLALAVAEFVVASWVELQLTRPAVMPVGPPARPEAERAASQIAQSRLPPLAAAPEPRFETRWLIGLSAEPVWLPRDGHVLWQLSVHGQQRPSRHLALGLALSVAHGEWEVDWPNGNGARAIALLTSTSGRFGVGYVAEPGPLELLAGVGVRFGMVYMAGWSRQQDLRADELYAPWGGPLLQLSAAVRLGPLRVGLELEAGYVTLPVEALVQTRVVTRLDGLWLAPSLAARWMF